MHIFLQSDEYAPWLAPYAYAIVILGFLFFLFRVFESWYAAQFNKPLYRHIFVYKKVTPSQLEILENEFSFYGKLSNRHKKQFRHRVATFIAEKKFVGREELVVTERMKVLIAAVGCMLSFGRKNYTYGLLYFILLYPERFYSNVNNAYHKGEFNPREKALVLSWKDFEDGYKITNDNLNLGIHEFMHALQLESKSAKDLDSARFGKQFQEILKLLSDQGVRDTLAETKFFRSYAFTNQYEFMAVLAEYFIESPKDFKSHFPKLYLHTQKLLNFKFAGY